MTCEKPELQQKLYRFVRRELDDAEEQRLVVEHLETCTACRSVFQELQWVMGSMRPSTAEEHAELMRELRRNIEDTASDVNGGTDPEGRGLLHRIKQWLARGGGSA